MNPTLETPVLKPQKNWMFSIFSLLVSQILLIFGFVQASAEKLRGLNLFLSYFFFMLSSKWRFSNPTFQNLGSNPTWFWKPEKNPFQTWKGPFLVYFKRATVLVYMLWNLSWLRDVSHLSSVLTTVSFSFSLSFSQETHKENMIYNVFGCHQAFSGPACETSVLPRTWV